MLIAILNQSTLVSDADATTMTQAVASQVRLDAAPLWDRAPAAVVFYTDPSAVPGDGARHSDRGHHPEPAPGRARLSHRGPGRQAVGGGGGQAGARQRRAGDHRRLERVQRAVA